MRSQYRNKDCGPSLTEYQCLLERFIQTLQQECLEYFIVFGQQQLDHLVTEVLAYYHEERPHQSKENDLLLPATTAAIKKRKRKKAESTPEVVPVSQIECR